MKKWKLNEVDNESIAFCYEFETLINIDWSSHLSSWHVNGMLRLRFDTQVIDNILKKLYWKYWTSIYSHTRISPWIPIVIGRCQANFKGSSDLRADNPSGRGVVKIKLSEKNGTRRKVGYVKYGLRRKTQSHQHRKELKNFSNQLRRRLFHLTVSYLQRKLYSMLAYIWHRLCTFVSLNFFFFFAPDFVKQSNVVGKSRKSQKVGGLVLI